MSALGTTRIRLFTFIGTRMTMFLRVCSRREPLSPIPKLCRRDFTVNGLLLLGRHEGAIHFRLPFSFFLKIGIECVLQYSFLLTAFCLFTASGLYRAHSVSLRRHCRSAPVFCVDHAVLQRLAYVRCLYILFAGEVGDGACDLEYSCIGAIA